MDAIANSSQSADPTDAPARCTLQVLSHTRVRLLSDVHVPQALFLTGVSGPR